MTKVSIITPTFDREKHLPQILGCIASQDYPDFEWLILDDSPAPSQVLGNIAGSNIRYEHISNRVSIGEKRNRLVEQAKGEIIVHFDDDDFYAADYVSTLVAAIQDKDAGLLNLRGWFLYDFRSRFFGYWDLNVKEGLHFECGDQAVRLTMLTKDKNGGLVHNHLGFGFGWAYRKEVWQRSHFPDKDWNEDGEFALAAAENFKLDGISDDRGICLHILHASNTSICFPQYQLPAFMLRQYFPLIKA